MDWYSMREGLIKVTANFNGGTIGLIVSQNSAAPNYNTVKDFPGFYTRTGIAGTSRTVYLSMTDQMTSAKLTPGLSSVDYGATATTYSAAQTSSPELMHPNTTYYVHIYYGKDLNENKYSRLQFTTTKYPSSFPSSRATWSEVYNKLNSGAVIEIKKDEIYFLPFRFYEAVPSDNAHRFRASFSSFLFLSSAAGGHPFRISVTGGLRLYDFYSAGPSGPRRDNFTLFDALLVHKIDESTNNFHWLLMSASGPTIRQSFAYNTKVSLISE